MNIEELIDKIVDIAKENSFDGLNVDCIERDLDKLLNGYKVVKENELLHSVSNSFCKCDEPKYNYPEMLWCDTCGNKIVDEKKYNLLRKFLKWQYNDRDEFEAGDDLMIKTFLKECD